MGTRSAWHRPNASGMVTVLGCTLIARFNAVLLGGPFSEIDRFAALAAKRPERIARIPWMFFAAMGARHDHR
jgi:hypothetical protein